MVKTITIIFIRHGEKQFSNNKGPLNSYQHDSPIINNEENLHEIKKTGEKLIKIYGEPNYCIISPYLRCRETLKYLLQSNINPSIYVDPNISEYLGNQKPYLINNEKSYVPLVSKETLKFNPPIIRESFEDMFLRSNIALENIFNSISSIKNIKNNFNETYHQILNDDSNKNNENIVIWVITHGIIISSMYKILSENYDLIENYEYNNLWKKSPETLQGLVIIKKFNEDGIFKKF